MVIENWKGKKIFLAKNRIQARFLKTFVLPSVTASCREELVNERQKVRNLMLNPVFLLPLFWMGIFGAAHGYGGCKKTPSP